MLETIPSGSKGTEQNGAAPLWHEFEGREKRQITKESLQEDGAVTRRAAGALGAAESAIFSGSSTLTRGESKSLPSLVRWAAVHVLVAKDLVVDVASCIASLVQ